MSAETSGIEAAGGGLGGPLVEGKGIKRVRPDSEDRPDPVPLWMALANVVCELVGLFVTVAPEIPRHARLEKGGKQEAVIRELILYNWPRTLSITGSTLLTLLMLVVAFTTA